MTKRILTQESLKEQLHYNPDTGIFTWIAITSKRVKVGRIAGTVCKIGYIGISIFTKRYYAHRLACLYMKGEMPINMIDHVNMNKSDNRWCNLREANKSQNMTNRGKQANNTSGFKGVYLDKRKKLSKWQARCNINGVNHHLGGYPTAELASEAYKTFVSNNLKEFHRI